MANLMNKNKALRNLSLNLKTDNQTKKKQPDLEQGCFFFTDHLLQNFKI